MNKIHVNVWPLTDYKEDGVTYLADKTFKDIYDKMDIIVEIQDDLLRYLGIFPETIDNLLESAWLEDENSFNFFVTGFNNIKYMGYWSCE